MAVWYRQGTVTVTNGSPIVTSGGDTAWSDAASPGDAFRLDGQNRLYEVDSVQSSSQLTLSEPFAGSSQSGAGYAIIPYVTGTLSSELVTRYAELGTRWRDRERQMWNWLAGTPDGGPNEDGFYPVTDWGGTVHLIPCPALYTSTYLTVTLPNRPMAGQIIAVVPLAERLSIPANFARSRGWTGSPPSEATDVLVYDNNTLVGTITWAADAAQPTFPVVSRHTMNAGRRLRLVMGEGLLPTTLSGTGLTLTLERGS